MAFNTPPLNFWQPNTPMQPTIAAQESSGTLVVAGLFAIASGVLGFASWLADDALQTSFDKAAIVIAAVGAIVGGVLAVSGRSIGAAIGLGGAVFFSNHAVALIFLQLDFDRALDPTSSKLLAASGVAGLVATGLGLATFRGRAGSVIGTIIAAVAFVPAVATGALVRLDDAQETYQVGIVGGYVLVAIVVLIGGLRGRWGVLASMVAAVAHLPLWIETVKDIEERKAAALAGLISFGGIAVLGAVAARAASSAGPTVASSTPSPGHAAAWAGGPMGVAQRFGPSPTGRQHASSEFGHVSQSPPGSLQKPQLASPSAVSGQWADDPYGRFQSRYWNGMQWTEHVSSDGVNAIDPI